MNPSQEAIVEQFWYLVDEPLRRLNLKEIVEAAYSAGMTAQREKDATAADRDRRKVLRDRCQEIESGSLAVRSGHVNQVMHCLLSFAQHFVLAIRL